MNVNSERLWMHIQHLHDIGCTEDGGVTRFSFTEEEKAVKQAVAKYMQDAGLVVREDAVGNLIGRREGTVSNLPVVLVGSHLDSVPNGGDFDGPLGVLSAIEALCVMEEQEIRTNHPIEVVAFTDEEGARFRYGMIGSRGIAGTLTKEELEEHHDAMGTTVAEAMLQHGLNPDNISQAARHPHEVKGYIELHIEQGKVLESANQAVGVVTGIAGPLWLKFTLGGEAGHAGTTPMTVRHDALSTAAEILLMIEKACKAQTRTVGTVGQLQVYPGGVNIIPGRVEFTLDLRDVDLATRDKVEQKILRDAELICEQKGVTLKVETLQRINPVLCDGGLQTLMAAAATDAGVAAPKIVSGAGHDGMQFDGLWPIGMLFARSKDGISHHPGEYTTQADCAIAAEVLFGTLVKFANETE